MQSKKSSLKSEPYMTYVFLPLILVLRGCSSVGIYCGTGLLGGPANDSTCRKKALSCLHLGYN